MTETRRGGTDTEPDAPASARVELTPDAREFILRMRAHYQEHDRWVRIRNGLTVFAAGTVVGTLNTTVGPIETTEAIALIWLSATAISLLASIFFGGPEDRFTVLKNTTRSSFEMSITGGAGMMTGVAAPGIVAIAAIAVCAKSAMSARAAVKRLERTEKALLAAYPTTDGEKP